MLKGYVITSAIVADGPSNPLLKTVAQVRGQWFANFGIHKWMMLAPALAIVGPLLTLALTAGKRAGLAFVTSGIGILGIISTAGVSMFPFLMPSDIMPQASLTVWDATSSQLTLFVMLIATLIFLPIVLAYTGFVFRVLRGPVTSKQIEGNSANLLLRSKINVVLRLGSRPWFCLRLRRAQCRLARAPIAGSKHRRIDAAGT